MKKVFALVLCLTLGLAMLPTTISLALPAEEDFVDFTSSLTSGFDKSSSQWFSSTSNRALLTISLLTEVMVQDQEAVELVDVNLSKSSYVFRGGVQLGVLIQGDENSFFILFTPTSGEISYRIGNFASNFLAEMMLDDFVDEFGGSYKENDTSSLLEVLQLFKDAIDS